MVIFLFSSLCDSVHQKKKRLVGWVLARSSINSSGQNPKALVISVDSSTFSWYKYIDPFHVRGNAAKLQFGTWKGSIVFAVKQKIYKNHRQNIPDIKWNRIEGRQALCQFNRKPIGDALPTFGHLVTYNRNLPSVGTARNGTEPTHVSGHFPKCNTWPAPRSQGLLAG